MACHYQKHPDNQKKEIEGNCHICTEDSKNYFCRGYKFYIHFQTFEVIEVEVEDEQGQ